MRPLAIILTIFLFSLPPSAAADPLYLELYQPQREKVLLAIPAAPGGRFRVCYTHSSDLTPIIDHFVIVAPGRIVLEEEEFLWYGAGLEFRSTEGSRVVFDGRRTRVLLQRPFDYVPIRVGRVAGHRVEINDQSISLRSLAGAGELVWIQVVNRDIPPAAGRRKEGEIHDR